MIFKGEEISIRELARRTGISYGTLEYRYNQQGLRDDDLLNGKDYRKTNMFTYNGEAHEITTEERNNIISRNLNLKLVQKRLDAGWDYDLATNLSKAYVTVDNTICLQIKVNKHFYHIPYDELPDLQEQGISPQSIRNTLRKGDIYDIVPTGTIVYINGVKQTGEPDVFDEMEDEYIEKKVQAYKEERHREKKAHLYKVPQKHHLDKYTEQLMKEHAIARIKVDMYGNAQLI